MKNCRNCNEPVDRNYCPNCGQPAQLKRIDRYYVVREIACIFYAEEGMIYTVKKMFINPGKSTRQYLSEDRSRFVKPITSLIITSLVYTVISHFFHIEARDFYQRQPEIEFPTANIFINWMIDYNGYTSIFAGLFVAFWIKLFFRKSGYNLFEIFTFLCYILGTAGLFFSVIAIVQGLTKMSFLYTSFTIGIAYYTWATGAFLNSKKAVSYIKAFIAYMLGFILIGFTLASVAIFIDLVIKK